MFQSMYSWEHDQVSTYKIKVSAYRRCPLVEVIHCIGSGQKLIGFLPNRKTGTFTIDGAHDIDQGMHGLTQFDYLHYMYVMNILV